MSIGGLVILEGHDGCGKSTLAKELARRNAMTTIIVNHGPYPEVGPEDLMETYARSMKRLDRLPPGSLVILDRCWISEEIYGRVARHGANRIDASARRYLERVAAARRGIVVIPFAHSDKAFQAWVSRPTEEYLQKREEWDEVSQIYYGGDFSLEGVPEEQVFVDYSISLDAYAAQVEGAIEWRRAAFYGN